MQRDVLAERGQTAEDDDLPQLKDFGLRFPVDYVRRAYMYVNRGWGWPESGGWADQDQRLLDDLDTYHEQYLIIARATQSGGIIVGSHYEEQQTTAERRHLGTDEL